MSVFSGEQMYRPLFEEPTAGIARPDGWSPPYGFLIGGGANLSLQHLGQQYFDAAYVLGEAIRAQQWEDYRLANPVLYLYRHSIELFLKAIMQGAARTHSLDSLAEEYQQFIKDEFDADVPEWIVGRMKELGTIDPNSTAFRYNVVYDKATKADVPVDGEYHVDLAHLQSAMLALNTVLVGVIAAVACGEGKSAR